MAYQSYADQRREIDSQAQSQEGVALIKPDCGLSVVRPVWDKGMTVFRPFPVPVDPSNPSAGFQYWRNSEMSRDLSGWVILEKIIKGVGTSRTVTFLEVPDGWTMEQCQVEGTPYQLLYNAVWQRARNKDAVCEALVRREVGAKEAPPLTKPQPNAFVQGGLFERGNTKYSPPRRNVVLAIPASRNPSYIKTGWDLLEEQMMKQVDGVTPQFEADARNPEFLSKLFEVGDLLDPNAGCFIYLYQAGQGPQSPQAPAQQAANWDGETQQSGQGNSIPYYAGEFAKTHPITGGATAAIPAEVICEHWKPWEDVMRRLTPKEQIEMLCSALPHDVMRGVFSGRGMLPEAVEYARSTVDTGAAQPPAAQPAQPPASEAPPQPPVSQPAATSVGGGADWGAEEDEIPFDADAQTGAQPSTMTEGMPSQGVTPPADGPAPGEGVQDTQATLDKVRAARERAAQLAGGSGGQ